MKMPVSELGDRMSNYELNVFWPAYFAQRRINRENEENQRGRK